MDATQDEQEDMLLAKSPEYRRNEMIMLEEFRRRKNMQSYWELRTKHKEEFHKTEIDYHGKKLGQVDDDEESRYLGAGPERYFENEGNECYDANDFTMIFLDSDSVTNVTSLNRVNHRRVLIFIGNERGLISFGKGKGEDYE